MLWGTPARETPCPVPLPVKVSAATRLCTLAVWPPASYWPSLSSVPAMVPSRCHRHPHVAAGQLSTRPPLGIAGAPPPPPSPVLFLHPDFLQGRSSQTPPRDFFSSEGWGRGGLLLLLPGEGEGLSGGAADLAREGATRKGRRRRLG